MLKTVLLAFLLAFAGPAWADTTAVYKSAAGAEMTVEISANGNARSTMDAHGTYMLTVDGQDYFVLFTAKGTVVDRASDVGSVMADYMQKLMSDNRIPQMRDAPHSGFDFIQGGQVTVQGRAGTAWSMKVGDGPSSDTGVVISADPDLAELGRVVARQFEASVEMLER